MYISFNRFELNITKKDAAIMSHQGDCDVDVAAMLPKYKRQLQKIGNEKIVAELQEYGAWSKEELSDETENFKRILWLASGDLLESIGV